MKRSIQEIIELLIFGLIAVLIGTGVLWVVGWVIGGLGGLFKLLAGLIWSLLRFVVPIAVVGAAVYALVRLLQGQKATEATASPHDAPTTTTAGAKGSTPAPSASPATTTAPPPAGGTSTKPVEPSTQRAAVVNDEIAEDEGSEDRNDRRPPRAGAEADAHEADEDDHRWTADVGDGSDPGESASAGDHEEGDDEEHRA